MSKSFQIPLKNSADELYKLAKEKIEQENGLLIGNTVEGIITLKEYKLSYNITDSFIEFTIKKKPVFIPDILIKQKLIALLSQL